MVESVSGVDGFLRLMEKWKAAGKNPEQLQMMMIAIPDRGSEEYQSIKVLTELHYGKLKMRKFVTQHFTFIMRRRSDTVREAQERGERQARPDPQSVAQGQRKTRRHKLEDFGAAALVRQANHGRRM